MIYTRTNSQWREVTSGGLRISGKWRAFTRFAVFTNGVWEEQPQPITLEPLTATVDPATLSRATTNENRVTTDPATVFPAGGAPPYTYSWQRTAGEGFATTPTRATTTFSTDLQRGDRITSTFVCTVTDSEGQTATVSVQVTFVYVSVTFPGQTNPNRDLEP